MMDYIRFSRFFVALCDVGIIALTCLGVAWTVEFLQHIGMI